MNRENAKGGVMMWIGLIVGIVAGAVLWGMPGVVVLGFTGWLVGLVVDSRRRDKAAPRPATVVREPIHLRVERLERKVAELEAKLSGAVVPAEVVAPAQAGAQSPAEAVAPAEVVAPAQAGAQSNETPAYAGVTTPPPAKPNPLWAWLTGGNTIARVGLVILFIGLAFLLKYAADNDMLPVELRVGAVAVGGIVLLVLGWRLRESRRGYALGLQGTGVAVLYLTTFASLRLWHLIPPEAAFFLLAAIAAFSAILAIKQDALVLAVFGASGGFLAPVLASTGGGSHVMLFSYFLVLNLGIAAIAFYKAWRPLNLVGFLFTFGIGLAWGLKYYQPDMLESVEPFIGAFFLLYVAIAILFARRQAPELKHYVDGTIVFGVPLAVFGLQAGAVKGVEFALSFSALGMAAVYVLLAWILKRTRRESYGLLVEAFVALAVVFATVAIPLALDARWTSAAWAAEGAAIVWVGTRQNRKLARAFGLLLQFAAGLAYLEGYHRVYEESYPLVDAPFVGAVLVALAGLWTSRLMKREGNTPTERSLSPFVFAWGVLWWLFAAHHEILAFVPYAATLSAHVGVLAGTALVFGMLALRWSWAEAAWVARLLLPALLPFVVLSLAGHRHPFNQYGWLAWPAAIAVHFWVLRRLAPESMPKYVESLHAGAMLVVAALGAKELNWVAAEYTAHGTAWSVAAAMVVPAVLVLLAASRAVEARWPIDTNAHAYRVTGTAVLAVALAMWSVYANISHDGRSDPLPYLPIVNALDLGHVLGGLALVAAWLTVRRTALVPPGRMPGKAVAAWAGGIAFIWLTGVLLRTLHHWADVPYRFEAMRRSVLVQASLSVFWSLLALGLMVYATRKARRPLWMVGAGLMAVVVVKLFLVDLSHVGGIERIVSFIAVGVLMLVIGYFSPVPPRKTEAA